ncbi:hypothetical protein K32_16830 [Kaistia sp. 32K]|uniref:DUF4893 domain-containing protein n=1 Tax=Kaistia sp. 32K TaxID=2795690 RepID=UPI00191647F2|nr:DUF4893 domain-containing protein [Kaistia sp. 32K]BCP53066.1 hypothetical protein K32_16830 [Kaistia sp. 32K]
MTPLPKPFQPRTSRLPRSLRLLPAMVLLLVSGSAFAEGTMAARTLTKTDKGRLDRYEATRAEALKEARAGGGQGDVSMIDAMFAIQPQPILGVDIRGSYNCRTIKLGGGLPLTVYDWFACRIDEDDLGYRLVKTSGSQRLSGHFIDESDKRLIYYGADHFANEKPRRYGAKADNDQVGYFYKTGPKSYRLDLPEPKFESKFDIIELKKR